MKKFGFIFLLTIILCSCGRLDSNPGADSYSDNTVISEITTTTTTTTESISLEGEVLSWKDKHPEEEKQTTTTTQVAVKENKKLEVFASAPDSEEETKEYIVYKPSTHYVHRSTCHWVDNECFEIDDTERFDTRLCTECNPDIEIKHLYKEPVITTTQKATAAQTQTQTEAAKTTTTKVTEAPKTEETKSTTTKKTTTEPQKIEEEIEVQNTYRLPYILSASDWNDICKVVCNETGYCGEYQQKAVANTIFNRIIWASKYGNYNPYPTDVYSIVRQKNQYNAIYQYRNDARLNPGGSLWNQTMQYIKEAASEPDFTNGAIGYYNPAMSGFLPAFESNRALLLCYTDGTGRFFRLNPACYTQK